MGRERCGDMPEAKQGNPREEHKLEMGKLHCVKPDSLVETSFLGLLSLLLSLNCKPNSFIHSFSHSSTHSFIHLTDVCGASICGSH